MRIVAYSNEYMPTCRAGAQTMLRDLLRPLKDRHQVDIVVHNPRGMTAPYTWDGLPVHPESPEALDIVRAADLIITQIYATEPAARIAEERDIPVIQLMHGDEQPDREFLRHRCDFLVFNSEWIRESFVEYTGPSAVIYPPVRPEEYRTTPGDRVALVNITDVKGSAVFYALAERYPELPFLGVIGAYGRQDIRTMPNVEIAPSVDDMTLVYRRTRVLLMPSVYESFGRCSIEAAASGIPTIAAPTPGLREALGDAGTFCEIDDLDAWRSALATLTEPAAWAEASARALERSHELARIRHEHLAVWDDIVNSFARRTAGVGSAA